MNVARVAPLLDRTRTVLLCLCLTLWLPGFFTLPPTDRDESRFALATRQMVESGDYVRIMNGAVPRSKKPIGIHWLQAPFVLAARAASVATRNPIWPYRIVSLLGGILAVLATADIARTLLPDRRAGLLTDGRAGLLAGAMLAASMVLTVEAHLAKTDAALLGATTLAMSVLARAWAGRIVGGGRAAMFWVALGAGILIKGPIAPMVAGLTAVTASMVRSPDDPGPDVAATGAKPRGRLAWLGCLHPIWGMPLMLLVVLPWFVAIGIDTHGAFFRQALGGDLGTKLAGGSEGHGAPPGLHLLLLPLLCFPNTLPILQGLAAAAARRREPATRFLLAWLVPSWLVFEAVPTKLPHYTLPLYPALCLLAADMVTRRQATALLLQLDGKVGMADQVARARAAMRAVSRTTPFARALLLVAAAAVAIGAVAAPLLLHAPFWLGVPASLFAIILAIVGWKARPLVSAVCAVPLYVALIQFELPWLAPLWVAPAAASALRAAWPSVPADGEGVFAVGYAEPSLMFLVGPRLRWLPTGALAARSWESLPHAAAFIAAPEVAGFVGEARRAGLTVAPVARIAGSDTARGKPVTLDLFVK